MTVDADEQAVALFAIFVLILILVYAATGGG